MKKLYPLLSVLFLIYWGCDDPKEENKPTPVTLSQDSYVVLKWNMNDDTDFFRYSLYGSNNSSMENKTLIYETQTRLDTTYSFDSNENFPYYQVDVMNLNEMVSSSNILINDWVNLWGEYYSIENTDSLNLSGNSSNGWDGGLTGEIPPEIGDLTNLRYLILHSNQLIGTIPPEIGNLTNLTDLEFGNNELTGSIPSEIWNLTNLTYLGLSRNQLTGSIPSEIGNLTNLTNLNLSDNQLSGSIPSEIGLLTNLEWLDLNLNQLTGSIPSEIGNLTNLEGLWLWSNQLTGEIPSEIGNLTNLNYLYLYFNQLTGSIPPEIGNLTNLTELYLTDNELTGIIPDEICNQGDSSPQLGDNQLCPPYPSCIEDYVGEQDTSDCD